MSVEKFTEALNDLERIIKALPDVGKKAASDLTDSAKSVKAKYGNWESFIKSCSDGLAKKAKQLAAKDGNDLKKGAEGLEKLRAKYHKNAKSLPNESGEMGGNIWSARDALIEILEKLETPLADCAELNKKSAAAAKKVGELGDEWSDTKNRWDKQLTSIRDNAMLRILDKAKGVQPACNEMAKTLGRDLKNFKTLLSVDSNKHQQAAGILKPKAEDLLKSAKSYESPSLTDPLFYVDSGLREASVKDAQAMVDALTAMAKG